MTSGLFFNICTTSGLTSVHFQKTLVPAFQTLATFLTMLSWILLKKNNGHLISKVNYVMRLYRDRLKGVQILLSRTQAGPGRKVKQEQEEISANHVQAF